MGDGATLIEILILGLIAAFLIFRLRSVLGKRTGHEQRRPNPFSTPPQTKDGAQANDKVVALPERNRPSDGEPVRPDAARTAKGGLTQVKIADPSFDERGFVNGAKAAFSMIVEAFAAGDTAALRPLLDDELYDSFSTEIRRRLAENETRETTIVKIRSAEIVEAQMSGNTALVTVKFVSDQINVTRDETGAVVDGDPDTAIELTDLWSFSRNTRSTDPNWTLVATATPT
ncbi:MAG: Tim44/TimA family putative adaptor protein [Inquilinaceae bacterium]